MAMKITNDSHLDHGLSQAQVDYLLSLFGERDGFFIETIKLPEELGTAPCGLYGPLMGDEPISDDIVHFGVRGNRPGKSRLISKKPRLTRQVSVIAGPHEDEPCILYTAFGGPVTPRETFDPGLQENEAALEESRVFWSQHALAAE